MNKLLYILGALLIAGFAVLGVIEMQNARTPYVKTIDQARKSSVGRIQFMGGIIHDEVSYDEKTRLLHFALEDADGKQLEVIYDGVKPANFDEAEKAVVVGSYSEGAFNASRVMLKCPSKYEGR